MRYLYFPREILANRAEQRNLGQEQQRWTFFTSIVSSLDNFLWPIHHLSSFRLRIARLYVAPGPDQEAVRVQGQSTPVPSSAVEAVMHQALARHNTGHAVIRGQDCPFLDSRCSKIGDLENQCRGCKEH